MSDFIPQSGSGQSLNKKPVIIAIAVIFSLIVVGVVGFTIHSNNVKAEKEAIRAEQALLAYQAELEAERIRNDVTWVPDGYYAWQDDKSVAWKWVKNVDYDCYDCTWWTVEVVSKYGCPNGLYGEINIEQNGVVIGYANDTLNYLDPYQAGRLTLVRYPYDDLTGDLTELNCR